MARILLADDDPTALDLVSRALTAEGHNVVCCCDGQEALQRLLAAPGEFALLLSDVEMPGLDGIELAKRARSAAPGLRILLMSGFSGGTGRIESLALPGVGFVTKPLSLEQIRASVRSALS
jgi:two-component system cell cycle response regulator CpdR